MEDNDFKDYTQTDQPTQVSELSQLAVSLGAVLLALAIGIFLIKPWLNLERAELPNLWEAIVAIYYLAFIFVTLFLLVDLIGAGVRFIRRHAAGFRNLVIGAGFIAMALFTLFLSIQFIQWLRASP